MVFKRPSYSVKGVVASEHPLASLVGVRILEEGGNAVDAAVAVSLTLAVVLPHLGGLGGDYFALARLGGNTVFVDGSGPAPRRLTRDLLLEKGYSEMPRRGPHTITVPGMVDALWRMWSHGGRLEWGRLVEPAARIAEEGFAASQSLARAVEANWEGLSSDPGSLAAYEAARKGPGARISFKGLAKALKRIASDPRDFYEGEVADDIVEYVRERGGVISREDLASYRAGLGEPLESSYRECKILETPPPTQGITTLHILKALEAGDPSRDPRGAERLELLYKASVWAYSLRDTYITDPRYMSVDAKDLLSPDIIREGAVRVWGGGDTTYYAVADSEGNIVSGIQSLYNHFGSLLTTRRFQITLNNRGSDFTLDPGHVNRLEPGKRTLHTLSTPIMECRDGVYALGTSGGHYRPHQHAQLITNIVDYEMDPQVALEHPRMLIDFKLRRIIVEEGLEAPSIGGFKVSRVPYPSRTGVAAAVYTGEFKAGYSDIRGDGLAVPQP